MSSDATMTKGLPLPRQAQAGQAREERVKHDFLHRMYECYWQELCRYLASRFRDPAFEPQEIAQQAFARLAAVDRPHDIGNPRAFLYKTAINAAIDHRRSSHRQAQLLSEYGVSDHEFAFDRSPEDVLLTREELAILERALMALQERDRTFLLLNRFEGVSFAEIARRTGMSPSGVRLIVETSLGKCMNAIRRAQRQGRRA